MGISDRETECDDGEQTVWRPILSSKHPVHAMTGLDLLTHESDVGVREHSSVEGILALPRAEARMRTGSTAGTFLSEGRESGAWSLTCVQYSPLGVGRRPASWSEWHRAADQVQDDT